jgi:integral membrane protein
MVQCRDGRISVVQSRPDREIPRLRTENRCRIASSSPARPKIRAKLAFVNELRRFRWVALLEGTSFVLLVFFAMPLKYWAGLAIAVRIVGMVHGLLFLAFVGALFQVAVERDWPPRRWGLAFLSSLVPFGTFAFDRSLKHEIASGT